MSKNYRKLMKSILTEKYGVECHMTHPDYKYRIGFEDLETELNANDELPPEEIPEEQVDADWNEGMDDMPPEGEDVLVDPEASSGEEMPEDGMSSDYYSSDDEAGVAADFSNLEGGIE